MFVRLITRRRDRNGSDRVDQWKGRRVEVRLEQPDNYQLDGDVVGELRRWWPRCNHRRCRSACRPERNQAGPSDEKAVSRPSR